MVFETNLISNLPSQQLDSDFDSWNMASPNNNDLLNSDTDSGVAILPVTPRSTTPNLSIMTMPEVILPNVHSSLAASPRSNNDVFVIDCDDIEIDTAIPSCAEDDGISMNYSLASFEEKSEAGIFMTDSSAKLPMNGSFHHHHHNFSKSDSISRGSLTNSIIGSSIGGNNGKDNGSVVSMIDPSLGAGDSRASLISMGKPKVLRKDEKWYHILSQVGPPFLIAGLGMVCAGLLLDNVITWDVFKTVGELVILVTPLLGLKGNLEMTLAARLSTHCNIGNMDIKGNKWKICSGNLVLDQAQAIVCGLVASLIAICMGIAFNGEIHLDHVSLVIASSILTASMVSLILGSTMISVILLSKRFRINPDNVATPVAGSLGDVVTLGMLSLFARIIFNEMNNGRIWIAYIIITFYILILPVCLYITYRNDFTRAVVISGWIPLLASVVISTGGGLLLDLAGKTHPSIALYQPVINGIGGNLVSVQASRISTELHGDCEKGILPNKGRICESPFTVYFTKSLNSMSARLLLFLAVPGHLIFSTVTHFVSPNGDAHYGPVFLALYITAAVLQVFILLYIAKLLTNLCWKRGVDPDTATIPYLTALGDLFGSALLYLAFELLSVMSTSY